MGELVKFSLEKHPEKMKGLIVLLFLVMLHLAWTETKTEVIERDQVREVRASKQTVVKGNNGRKKRKNGRKSKGKKKKSFKKKSGKSKLKKRGRKSFKNKTKQRSAKEHKSQRRGKDCQEIPGKLIKSALRISVPKARSS